MRRAAVGVVFALLVAAAVFGVVALVVHRPAARVVHRTKVVEHSTTVTSTVYVPVPGPSVGTPARGPSSSPGTAPRSPVPTPTVATSPACSVRVGGVCLPQITIP